MPRVLHYLEPVVFRNDPLLAATWHHFADYLSARSRGLFESALATSQAMAALPHSDFTRVFTLSGSSVLESAGFDRARYCMDIAGTGTLASATPDNGALRDALTQIRDAWAPDIVIAWGENRYLPAVFGPEKCLYMELGPLPRGGMKLGAFLDPFGHQRNCAFSRMAAAPADERPVFEAFWKEHWLAHSLDQSRRSGLDDWLATLPAQTRSRKRLLLALQPEDWLTYEGCAVTLEPASLLRSIAAQLPAEWIVIPQWHGDSAPPGEALVRDLMWHHNGIVVPPASLRQARSEALLPHVDALATISSNVAAAAAIIGKPVMIVGESKFSALNGPIDAAVAPRMDLLGFLLERYCRPIRSWLDEDGTFARHLFETIENRDALLAPAPQTLDRGRDFIA